MLDMKNLADGVYNFIFNNGRLIYEYFSDADVAALGFLPVAWLC